MWVMDSSRSKVRQNSGRLSQAEPEPRQEWVSIIIPCHNMADYLEEAIQSALRQSHKCVQIIVVDDGSEDATREVAAQYEGQCLYLRQSNQGLAVARNTGLKHSTGTYIVFLDADDRLQAHCVRAGLDCFQKGHPVRWSMATTVALLGTGNLSPPPSSRTSKLPPILPCCGGTRLACTQQ